MSELHYHGADDLFELRVPAGWSVAESDDTSVRLVSAAGDQQLRAEVLEQAGPRAHAHLLLWGILRPRPPAEVHAAVDLSFGEDRPLVGMQQQFVLHAPEVTGNADDTRLCHGVMATVSNGQRVLLLTAQAERPDAELLSAGWLGVLQSVELSDRPNVKRFVRRVLSVIRRRFPLARVQYDRASRVVLFNESQCGLDSLYRQASLNPEQFELLVARRFTEFLRQQERGLPAGRVFREVKDRVMPILLQNRQLAQYASVVTRPFVNDVSIAYVVDEDRSFWYIGEALAEQWGVSPDQLHELALENLRSYAEQLEVQVLASEAASFRLAIINRNDGYDASRLLLPDLHRRMSRFLGSPFYAAIPNRDFLLAFTMSDQAVLALRGRIEQDVRQQPYPISDQLFLVTADGVAGQEPASP